jgi:phosphate starvation-inducible PhoH-like protein
MRGRTLNDAFVILDEAQNTTSEQMKMFLTRIGFSSKAVITGDITQIDLPSDKPSGLVEAKSILQNIEGIRFVYFTKRDVVRHRLVQDIIEAYEDLEARRQQTAGREGRRQGRETGAPPAEGQASGMQASGVNEHHAHRSTGLNR